MSFTPAKLIEKAQTTIDERLIPMLIRRADQPWLKPISAHTQLAFDNVQRWRETSGVDRPIWLDSGCGTGMSTRLLALANPDVLVIGVDRSEARLGRGETLPDNACLIRADLVDFWRLAVQAGWKLWRHTILYPNPYPKPEQLSRRWYAHPVFPQVLQLAGVLSVRSNWQMYVEECACVCRYFGYTANVEPLAVDASVALTLFEKKYAMSGHDLWSVEVDLTL
jgi:tRNA (guanine-N7-)-methyltransferase